jgi:hypothetical protein
MKLECKSYAELGAETAGRASTLANALLTHLMTLVVVEPQDRDDSQLVVSATQLIASHIAVVAKMSRADYARLSLEYYDLASRTLTAVENQPKA